MGPLVGDDGEIWFTHHYAVFQAFKPAATSEPSSGEVNRKLDWGLAEDGNRSNIVSAGAGTSNLHTNLQSVTQPEMPELAWRKLATRDDAGVEVDVEVLRKRLRWTATKRGWVEGGDFLTAWVDAGGLSRMDADSLPALDRLLKCDDMFLMSIVMGTKATPAELDTPALAALKHFADHDSGWGGGE